LIVVASLFAAAASPDESSCATTERAVEAGAEALGQQVVGLARGAGARVVALVRGAEADERGRNDQHAHDHDGRSASIFGRAPRPGTSVAHTPTGSPVSGPLAAQLAPARGGR
jgi:hypothetical protein